MNRWVVLRKDRDCISRKSRALGLLAVLMCCSLTGPAQNTQPENAIASFSIRATHLLGFEDAKTNSNGSLTIQDNALQFQHHGKSAAKIKTASVRDVFLGGESKQVGGLPMTLGKAATPYGGGRVISLFAHKKYDTLTLEYLDSDGGLHGAIFQLGKGQCERLRNELVARGVRVSSGEGQPAKQKNADVPNENK